MAQVDCHALISNLLTNGIPVMWSSGLPVKIAVFYLFVVFVLIFSVDFLEVRESNIPLWRSLFRDGSVTEWIQWSFLAGSVMISAHISGALHLHNERASAGFFVLSVAFSIMLIEDSGNIRHRIGDGVVAAMISSADHYTARVAKNLFEIVFYSMISGLIIISSLEIKDTIKSSRPVKFYFLSGFVFYLLAAGGSATSYIGSWYAKAGHFILTGAYNFELMVSDSYLRILSERSYPYSDPGFWFMDSFVEESLELLGAAFLLSFLLTIIKSGFCRNHGDV